MQLRHRFLSTGSLALVTALGASLLSLGITPTNAASSVAVPCKLPSGFKVGIAIREMVNDADRSIVTNATASFKAAGASSVNVTDAGGDPLKQNNNIESLTNSGVDGLFVVLGDAQQVSPLTKKAADKGIKIASGLFGKAPEGSLTEVGFDDPLATSLMTRALFSAIGYKGDVYVFWVPGAPILETRKRIMEAIAKDYPLIKLHNVPTEHGAAKSLTQMTDILTANPTKGSIAGVWGAYDLLVSGANEAIRRVARTEIKVASIDGDKVAFQMLYGKNSPFVATVVGDTPAIGRLGAEAIIKAACGRAKEVPIASYIPMWVATRSNGIAAGQKRWGGSLWTSSGLNLASIKKAFPQTEKVTVVQPTLP